MNELKPTETFIKNLNKLGNNYEAKIIDGELCGYRLLNDSFDIEICGINNDNVKNIDFSVYLWQLKPSFQIIERFPSITSIEELIEILDTLVAKYKNKKL